MELRKEQQHPVQIGICFQTGNEIVIYVLPLRPQWIFKYYYYGHSGYLNITTTATVENIHCDRSSNI
jgi:hypothetical protein